MAEVRGEAEGEVRSQATDHPERTKPDHLHSSQGPLSSIRAAIKRTRTTSQSDPTRERRRPEITIVSAEPLVSNDWFSGTSGLFPRPPQSGWSPGLQAVPQPPPSYDQVIQEKTQEEHIFKPTAAPRRTTCTSSSATQTEPVRKETSSAAAKSGKKPQKPPRPSLPKPVDRESLPESVTPADEKTGINTAVSTITEDQKVVSSNKYLKELLEVFAECEESCDIDNQSDEEIQGEDAGSEMNNNHSQRDIRARIQAFETPSEEGNEPVKPSPLPLEGEHQTSSCF
ncbi:hypothetical protein CgunFtcFv8_021825 [Champsocephalus gunnari]|uniref:Uncharacterized protein n=1 Tax=Champsocephalus gunnari TaxID=52237 RepID=A0AAN8DVI6_CHAGU|nr:hypothetical protein CgunFtcFv8_021825 [Champsocephalus gunnari]